MLIASLPMYDLKELHEYTDQWWSGLARALRETGFKQVPEELQRNDDPTAIWQSPNLLFSQCCGMDFVSQNPDQPRVQLVATPIYDTPECVGVFYRSLIIVRADDPAQTLSDLRQRNAAVNLNGSHSGYNALRYLIAPLAQGRKFFTKVIYTGSHIASIQAVQQQQADCAAIDCVSYALLQTHRPHAVQGLRILARSPYAPGLPFVTHSQRNAEQLARLQTGLHNALNDPKLTGARAALLLEGATPLSASTYQSIANMAQAAEQLRYSRIN